MKFSLLMMVAVFSVGMTRISLAEPPVYLLWPDGAPLAKGDRDVDKPSITAYLPPAETATGLAVVVCPGGGYAMLAMGHEGVDIAKWMNDRGIAAFVLKYRLATDGYHHPAPMLDVQRAMRVVRANAETFNIDPQRIGVMGFSAGGHLASTAATHFDTGTVDAPDPIDRVGCRPDYAILCYPVIIFDSQYTHKGSEANLLGPDPDPAAIKFLSSDKQVTRETPPTFLFHTSEDKAVPPENSIAFYQALQKHDVSGEMHIFQFGAHGVGLAANIPGTKAWPQLMENWLTARKLLPQPE
jgi:acetyl esterase/lipase